MVSSDVRSRFEASGYTVVRAAFPRDVVLALGRRVDAELERLRAASDALPEDMRKSIARSEMPAHDELASFRLDAANYRHLTDSKLLRAALEAVFGEGYVWHYPTMFRKIEPDSKDGFLPFHQDYSYNTHYSQLVTCWVPMNDCGVDAPSISVVPVNLTEKLDHTSDGKWENGVSETAVKSLFPGARTVDLECRAGDVVLFGELTLHRTCYKPSMNRARLSMDARAVPLSAISEAVRGKRRFIAADRAEIVTVPA